MRMNPIEELKELLESINRKIDAQTEEIATLRRRVSQLERNVATNQADAAAIDILKGAGLFTERA
jgi:cell division septum initiation protein DivIVA